MGNKDFTCTHCGELVKIGVMGKPKICPYCNSFTSSAFEKERARMQAVNPKCPNPECDNSDGSKNPHKSFKVTIIKQEGLMGKVFKEHGINMLSCTHCGHIIGVGSTG